MTFNSTTDFKNIYLTSVRKEKRPELYDIAFLIQHFNCDKKVCGITVVFKHVKTGYIHKNMTSIFDYNRDRKYFIRLNDFINENAELFDVLECFTNTVNPADTRDKLYIEKNQESMAIQNAIKINYCIWEMAPSANIKNGNFREFFQFTFKNVSLHPIYLFADEDLRFFSRFENFDVSISAVEHSKLVDKMYNEHRKMFAYTKTELDKFKNRISYEENCLLDLEEISNNSEKVTNNLYTIVSKGDVSAKLLLKTLKKM